MLPSIVKLVLKVSDTRVSFNSSFKIRVERGSLSAGDSTANGKQSPGTLANDEGDDEAVGQHAEADHERVGKEERVEERVG